MIFKGADTLINKKQTQSQLNGNDSPALGFLAFADTMVRPVDSSSENA